MCGRSSLTLTEKQLEERFQSTFYSEDLERYNPLPNFNVAPTHSMPIITMEDSGHFRPMAWGLVPFWAKSPSIGSKMINARVETIFEKSVFKQCMPNRRCLVPMDAWYEWLKEGNKKIPFRISVKEQGAFAVAGLFAEWKNLEGVALHSYTVITRDAHPKIAHIHNRMPAVLQVDQERLWISEDLSPEQAVKLLLQQENEFDFYPISERINKVSQNDPDLIAPIHREYRNTANDGQLSLF